MMRGWAILAVLLAGGSAAFGQASLSPTPAPAAPAPATPAPTAEAAERAWAVTCTEATAGAPRDCRIVAGAILRPQNQRLLTAIVLRQPETRSLALVFQVPHGAALPAGLAWQVDEAEAQRLAFQASDAEGLYAGVPVSDDLLATLRRGTALRVTYLAAARREPLTVSLPLVQFGEASTEFLAAERR
jgi:invasion protein IalB